MSVAASTPSPSRARWHRTFPELDQEVGPLIDALKGGLPASRVDALTTALGLPASRVADVLSIPTSTLNRRRKAGRLDRDESERAYRLARLVDRAADDEAVGSPTRPASRSDLLGWRSSLRSEPSASAD